VGEVVVLRIAAEIDEGEDGKRRLGVLGGDVGRRRIRARPFADAGLWRRAGLGSLDRLADKAEAALVECLDEDLVVAVVADRLAGGVDAARQSRLRDNRAKLPLKSRLC